MMAEQFSDLVDMQRRAVRDYSARDLFGTKIDGRWRWLTYREFGVRVQAARAGLAALGVSKGDCVAVIAANRVEWAICAYASYSLGALFTPMYEHQHEREWRYIAEDSGAKVLIVASVAIFETVADWPQTVGALEHVRCMDPPLHGAADRRLAGLHESGPPAPDQPDTAPTPLEPSDTAGLIYTSGTTGNPKGVILSHGNIISVINAVQAYVPMGRADLSVSFLPWAHSFGQVMELHLMLSVGAAMAFAESIPKLADNIAECRPTVLFAVPRVFNKIHDGIQRKVAEAGGIKKKLFDAAQDNARIRQQLDAEGRTSLAVELKHAVFDRLVFSKVRERFGGRLQYAFSGGAALNSEIGAFMDRLGIAIFEGYGLTETSPLATANQPGARRMGSVGRPIEGVEIRIDAAAGDESGQGEVLIRGPNIMQGYHRLPDETAAAIDGDGWFHSGDKGRVDADGYLYITGRIKEQYKLENGKYVVPAPLEQALQLSPLIGQAFIFGDNRPYNVALIVADPDVAPTPTDAELWEQVQRYSEPLRSFERPRKIAVLQEEFSVHNGMLTPKMSVRRPQVVQRYSALIDGLYDGDR